MKLNYSKKEIVNLMERKALFATPLSFNNNGFKSRVYLTSLHDGAIRISFKNGIPDVNYIHVIIKTGRHLYRKVEEFED